MSDDSKFAYFEIGFHGTDETFIIKLTEKNKIEHAREILQGKPEKKKRICGRIVKEKAAYNPAWHFHLEPSTIDFFDVAIEVCDASVRDVEKHLEEVGGSTLPNNHWCPWASKINREIPAVISTQELAH